MNINHWLRNIIIAIFNHLGLQASEDIVISIEQFVKFGIIGVTNTIISYVLNILVLVLLKPFSLRWDYIAANLFSFVVSTFWAFFWNNKYVFLANEGQSRSFWKTLMKSYVSYAFTGIFLSNLLSYFWIDVMKISKYIAPIINLTISVPLNFLINKKWAFKS